MTVKNISTRAKICGRSAKCTGGHSAVEQSSYISREKMYCEYDGQTYYPKYSEDLVHCEVLLPENAPKEYKDPYVLWNSVELVEKSKDAQLARTFRIELPNEWSYDLAKEVLKDYCERNFVSKGMCVQYAIHDSENEQGQRNLHAHIMLTLRGIDEQGKWMPKQKKVYKRDENGERIPDIDEKTGQQKVDKQNRKQWKCTNIQTNDWNSRENTKIWRKDLADTINAVNSKIGMTDKFWEYRSFKEQGLDIIPQIHLGEKASAMERAGIRTIRGDINREIIAKNAVINAARAAYEKAKEELAEVMAIPVTVAKAFKSEIIDVIRKIAERNNNRLTLITVLPEALQSPLLTAEWEHRLKEVERGKLPPEDFMESIAAMLRELIQTYRPIPNAAVLFPSEFESVGKCPRCGRSVVERKQGYFCEDRNCGFDLWKNSKFFSAKNKQLTPSIVAALLKDGRIRLSGCYSERSGKTYDAVVVMNDDGQQVNFSLEFSN